MCADVTATVDQVENNNLGVRDHSHSVIMSLAFPPDNDLYEHNLMVAKKAFTLISTPFRTEIEKEISLVHTVTSKPFGFTIPSDFSRASIQYLIHWPIEIMQ